MQPADSAAQNLARRLLALEAGANNPPDVHVALRACEQLRLNLAKPLGDAGFQALLARALTLTKGEVPWMEAVKLEPNSTLAGFEDNALSQPVEEAMEGGRVLLFHLIRLLITFIGEALTLQLLHNIWSEMPWERNSDLEEILS